MNVSEVLCRCHPVATKNLVVIKSVRELLRGTRAVKQGHTALFFMKRLILMASYKIMPE